MSAAFALRVVGQVGAGDIIYPGDLSLARLVQ